MDIVIDVLKVVIGFALLLKGADFFVDGAAAMALKLGIPEIVIGLTSDCNWADNCSFWNKCS